MPLYCNLSRYESCTWSKVFGYQYLLENLTIRLVRSFFYVPIGTYKSEVIHDIVIVKSKNASHILPSVLSFLSSRENRISIATFARVLQNLLLGTYIELCRFHENLCVAPKYYNLLLCIYA